MKRFWTAVAVTLLAIFTLAGCNDYGNTFQYPTGAAITSLSPSQNPACVPSSTVTCKGLTITINGGGFVQQTRAQWNGKTCPTTGTSCTTTVTLDTNNNVTSVTVTIPASFITAPGLATINTINPASGTGNNGLSNTINFIIGNPPNPPPTVSSVSPTCAVVGSSLALTVTGSNFLSTVNTTDSTQNNFSTLNWTLGPSQYQFTPLTQTPATITSTQITVTIPATVVGNAPGTAMVTVSNPPSPPVPNLPGSLGSGGGASPPTKVTLQTTVCLTVAKAQLASESSEAVAEETPALSLDGRYVAYIAVQNDHSQVFLRDTCEGAATGCQPHTSLISVGNDGDPAVGDSHSPSMSSDGRYVAFSSAAANLVENAPPGRQIYLRDTCAGAADSCKPSTILVSTDSRGALVGAESILPSLSSSGRFVAFLAVTPSNSANQTSAEVKSSAGTNNSGYRQVFIRDTCLGAANCTPKTTRISLQPGDGMGTDAKSASPALSGNASHVAIPGANAATLFKRSVAVDDRVFLAITGDQH